MIVSSKLYQYQDKLYSSGLNLRLSCCLSYNILFVPIIFLM